MSIDFSCVQCAKPYSVAESLAGKRARCKDCGAEMRIPTPAPAARAHEDDWDPYDVEDEVLPPRINESMEADDEEKIASPTRAGLKRAGAGKARAQTADEPNSLRKTGIHLLIFGFGVFLLPLAGLQWRLINFLPPVVQVLLGAGLVLTGAVCIVISSTGFLRVFGYVVIGAFSLLGLLVVAGVGLLAMVGGRPQGQVPRPGPFVQANPAPPQMPQFPAPPPGAPLIVPPAVSSAEAPRVALSNAKAVRGTGIRGTMPGLSFSVDYRLEGNRPFAIGQFHWVVNSKKGKGSSRIHRLDRSGTISGGSFQFREEDGPFETYLELEKHGMGGPSRERISDSVPLQVVQTEPANPVGGVPQPRPGGFPGQFGRPSGMPTGPRFGNPPGFQRPGVGRPTRPRFGR